MSTKLEFNKRLIGKVVKVIDGNFFWKGIVDDVVDESTFLVSNIEIPESKPVKVDIYDIRSQED